MHEDDIYTLEKGDTRYYTSLTHVSKHNSLYMTVTVNRVELGQVWVVADSPWMEPNEIDNLEPFIAEPEELFYHEEEAKAKGEEYSDKVICILENGVQAILEKIKALGNH